MTALQKKTDNPIAHLTAEDIEDLGRELDAIRAEVIATRGESDAAYIRKVIDVQRKLELGQPRGAAVLAVPAGLARRHRGPVGRQDPREHGDRPQRHARPVGLDARPEDPLDHLGVGQRLAVGAVEALAQRAAPHLHQRDRPRQRPRLRHHARRRGPALVPVLPRPAAVELHQRLLLRVRHRGLRPRARQEPALQEAPQAARSSRPAPSRCCSKIRGQVTKDYVVHPLLSGPSFLPHAGRERDRQPGPQPVDPLGDHVRPLPRGRRDLRAPLDRGRDPRRVVPAPDARLGQHHRQQG